MINHKDMVSKLAKPGVEIVKSMTSDEAHIIHMAIGVAGEAFELLEAAMNDDRDNVREELGDIEFYFEGLCQGTKAIITCQVFGIQDVKEDPLPGVLVMAGNVLDTAKKIVIYKDASKYEKLIQYMQSFRNKLDEFYALAEFTHAEAIEANINKLGKRYEGFNYSNEAAQARADKAGE